jgi:hypothetical protein
MKTGAEPKAPSPSYGTLFNVKTDKNKWQQRGVKFPANDTQPMQVVVTGILFNP